MSNILIGKTINAIKLASNKEAILFVTDAGEIIVKCYGDCCSHTWIEHINLPGLGFPAKVFTVEELDLPGSKNNHPEHDCLQVYGCKITTDKGEIIIDYRNSSNGYYGGDLEWPNDNFYNKINKQNVSALEWVDVTSDV